VRANRFIGMVCRTGNEEKVKKGIVRQGLYAYISPVWGAAPSQPIEDIFGEFSGLAA
jgi:hypothetical protein